MKALKSRGGRGPPEAPNIKKKKKKVTIYRRLSSPFSHHPLKCRIWKGREAEATEFNQILYIINT